MAGNNNWGIQCHVSNCWIGNTLKMNYVRLTNLLTYSMEKNSSWEANRFSASQESPRILWNPKVHHRSHKCFLWLLRNMIRFYGQELLAPRLTPKLEDYPSSAVRDCLFNIFTSTLHIDYTTNRQVAGSIPDGVIVTFQWHNRSSRTMALGLTQSLTEMSIRCISWG
jgi:hypothetical protein